jgi:hypothetical protein
MEMKKKKIKNKNIQNLNDLLDKSNEKIFEIYNKINEENTNRKNKILLTEYSNNNRRKNLTLNNDDNIFLTS